MGTTGTWNPIPSRHQGTVIRNVLLLCRLLLRIQPLPSMLVFHKEREEDLTPQKRRLGVEISRHFGRKGRKETIRLASWVFGVGKHSEEKEMVGLTLHLKMLTAKQLGGLGSFEAGILRESRRQAPG